MKTFFNVNDWSWQLGLHSHFSVRPLRRSCCRFNLLPYGTWSSHDLHVIVFGISGMFQKEFSWLVHAARAAFSKALVFSFFWKLSIFVPECRPPGITDTVGGPCSCFQIRIRLVIFFLFFCFFWLCASLLWLIIDYPDVRHLVPEDYQHWLIVLTHTLAISKGYHVSV